MNRNQLERLNKVLKTVIEESFKNPRIDYLNKQLNELNEELKSSTDSEDIRLIKRDISHIVEDIEEEKANPSIEHFKSYKCVRNQLINELVNESKKSRTYKNLLFNYECYRDDYYEYGFESIHKKLYDVQDQMNKLKAEYELKANAIVEGMEESGEFEQYYLIKSGKQEYLNKVAKIENIKSIQSKLDDIINNYSVKFAMLTIDDFKTYVELWNTYLDEPCDFKFEPCIKIKYLNKLYEVYKYEVEDSVLYERIQCCTIDGIRKDLSNIYLKEIEIVESNTVKPFDVITYKNETYEVYKIHVEGSELFKRVKAKSTISNKTRDFKNYYLRKVH